MPSFFIRIALFVVLVAMLGCDSPKATDTRAPEAQGPDEFQVVSGTNAEAIAELNAQRDAIVTQVLERHGLSGDAIEVTFGTPSGLGIVVDYTGGESGKRGKNGKTGKKVKLNVPAAQSGAELVTNFDHTLDKAVRRAAGLDVE